VHFQHVSAKIWPKSETTFRLRGRRAGHPESLSEYALTCTFHDTVTLNYLFRFIAQLVMFFVYVDLNITISNVYTICSNEQ